MENRQPTPLSVVLQHASFHALKDYRVRHALSIISNQFNNNELSIDTIARSVNLSPSRLRRLISLETSKSPAQIIKELRLQRSRVLLEQTFMSIKEITFAIGLNDVSHFVRDFKAVHGLTPKAYRERAKGHQLGCFRPSHHLGNSNL